MCGYMGEDFGKRSLSSVRLTSKNEDLSPEEERALAEAVEHAAYNSTPVPPNIVRARTENIVDGMAS